MDEEVEAVSTQLLKRTQAMLIKYRLLPLEESHPSAKMLMIDRTFIQEENTTPVLDKQLAKEKPNEYVSSSRSRPPAPRLFRWASAVQPRIWDVLLHRLCPTAVTPAHQACDMAWQGWWISVCDLGTGVLLPVLLLVVHCLLPGRQ